MGIERLQSSWAFGFDLRHTFSIESQHPPESKQESSGPSKYPIKNNAPMTSAMLTATHFKISFIKTILPKSGETRDAMDEKTPAVLEDYWQFVKQLKYVFEYGDSQVREKIIKRLVQKIEVNSDEVTMHMIVDESVVPREPKKGSRLFLCPKFVKSEVDFTGISNGARKPEIEQEIKKAPSFYLEALNHFFNFGSNTLTIGGGAGS